MDLIVCAFALLATCLQSISFSDAFSPHRPFSSAPYTPALSATDGGDEPSPSKERKPWDIFRFVGQSSKFLTPPSLPFIGDGKKGIRRKVKVKPGEILWTPSSTENFFSFAPLDDVVMGGASSSSVDNNTGMWTGTVTDANNGGFVGIRSTPFQSGLSLDMTGCKGVELRLRKGDGKRFKFVVRDSTEFNGICWTTEFDAKTGTSIPFAKQVPTIFANNVSGKTFDYENVVGFQVAYSKFGLGGQLNKNFQLGDFALQILELRVY